MPDTLYSQAAALAEIVSESQRTVLLSGAGMSTSAGIPDFRGSNGIYKRQMNVDPERIFDIDWFRRDPSFFYDFHREFLSTLKTVEPSFAHRFFASLEHHGLLSGIITQNIDSLHQKAGSRNVLEIHGGVWKSSCTHCGKCWGYEESISMAFEQKVPRCDKCGGVIKPDIVFFGEMVKHLEECRDLAESADLFIVAGSSLAVSPAAMLPALSPGKIAVVSMGEISSGYLPAERIDIRVDRDIDDFFKEVDKCMEML